MGERSNDYNADCIVVEQASEVTGLYLLLDKALPAANLVTLLFALEHCQGIEQLHQLVHTILKRTRGSRHRELRIAFLALSLPGLHVQQEDGGFLLTEDKNERKQGSQAAIYGRI